MKLYRNAIILVVVVGLLVGAYFLAGKYKKTGDNAANGNTTQTTALFELKEDNVVQVTLEEKDGTFIIAKKDKDWVLSSPTGMNTDSSKLTSIIANAVSVNADKTVEEDAKDLAQYGLDKPVSVIVKLKDGTEKTLQIGDGTPTKDGYYVKLKENNKVYVVSSYTAEAFLVKKNDLRSKTLFTLKEGDILSFSMDRKGENVFKAAKGSDSNWTLTAPIQGNASASNFPPMLTSVVGTSVKDFIEDNAPDLGKYGLANPSYAVGFSTASASYRLLLGSEKVKGSEIYAKMDGSNDVFTIDESAFNFLDKPLKEIVDVFAYMVNIDQVNKIELNMDGQKDTFGIEVYKDKDGKGDTDKDKFSVNGKDASAKDEKGDQPFRAFYQALIGISLDNVDVGAVPAGTPDISITYYLNKAPGTMKVDFISKDSNYYYVMRNGQYTGIEVLKNKGEYGIGGLRDSLKALKDFVAKQK